MTQTKLGSLIEAVINVLIGFGINFSANMLIFPVFGWSISAGQNLTLGLIYTGISVARSYVVRRWFNSKLKKAAEQLAARAAKQGAPNGQ
ncbi:DUF7220 family protein [Comamonas avium]|uniref:Uncharacterized protein n=1 Tax=Comamonas avium TaxID=2762231 RepID=A0ABR8SFJ1_9BURK|nr:hypothetical protein [Comamonas avium]MBD7962104.1 hypothetical protein [Comamonas avium]